MERTELFGRNLQQLLPSYKNNWNTEVSYLQFRLDKRVICRRTSIAFGND